MSSNHEDDELPFTRATLHPLSLLSWLPSFASELLPITVAHHGTLVTQMSLSRANEFHTPTNRENRGESYDRLAAR